MGKVAVMSKTRRQRGLGKALSAEESNDHKALWKALEGALKGVAILSVFFGYLVACR